MWPLTVNVQKDGETWNHLHEPLLDDAHLVLALQERARQVEGNAEQ